MALSNADLAAVAAFPELRRLIELRESGWVFVPHLDGAEVVLVTGVRLWPGGWADALGVLGPRDAQAARTDRDLGIVWKREGSLVAVVEGLTELPPPDLPGAPGLVIGTAWRRS